MRKAEAYILRGRPGLRQARQRLHLVIFWYREVLRKYGNVVVAELVSSMRITSLGTIHIATAGGTNARTIVVINSFEFVMMGDTTIGFHDSRRFHTLIRLRQPRLYIKVPIPDKSRYR